MSDTAEMVLAIENKVEQYNTALQISSLVVLDKANARTIFRFVDDSSLLCNLVTHAWERVYAVQREQVRAPVH